MWSTVKWKSCEIRLVIENIQTHPKQHFFTEIIVCLFKITFALFCLCAKRTTFCTSKRDTVKKNNALQEIFRSYFFAPSSKLISWMTGLSVRPKKTKKPDRINQTSFVISSFRHNVRSKFFKISPDGSGGSANVRWMRNLVTWPPRQKCRRTTMATDGGCRTWGGVPGGPGAENAWPVGE